MDITPAGKFRNRITLLKRNAKNLNELGETIVHDVIQAKLWAAIRPLSAREIMQAAQNSMNVTHSVTVKFRKGISHRDAFDYAGRRLDIVSIIDVEEMHIELQMLCHEVK